MVAVVTKDVPNHVVVPVKRPEGDGLGAGRAGALPTAELVPERCNHVGGTMKCVRSEAAVCLVALQQNHPNPAGVNIHDCSSQVGEVIAHHVKRVVVCLDVARSHVYN